MIAVISDEIKLESEIDMVTVLEMRMDAKINEHASLYIKAFVKPAVQKIIDEHVTLYMVKDDKISCLFTGYIIDYRINSESEQEIIELNCRSFTFKLDQKKKKRLFQNTSLSFGSLVRQVLDENGTASIIHRESDKVGRIYLQYDETDWEFLIRIASEIHEPIIPNITRTVPRISIGVREDAYYDLAGQKDYHIFFDFQSYRCERTKSELKINCIIHNNEQFQLGNRIMVNSLKWVVVEKLIIFSRGKIEYKYQLGKEQSVALAKMHNEKIQGLHLMGTVIKTLGCSINLVLDVDLISDRENVNDFSYFPLTGNIVYSMPEPGSKVMLYFPTCNEADSFVESCFLQSGTTYPHSDKKVIETANNKTICADVDSLSINNKNNRNQVKLEDVDGISFEAQNNIRINSKKKIRLRCRGICSVIAKKRISLCDRQDSKLSISGAEMIMHAPQIIASGLPPVFKVPLVSKDEIVKASTPIPESFAYHVLGGIPGGMDNSLQAAICGGIPSSCYPTEPILSTVCLLHIKE